MLKKLFGFCLEKVSGRTLQNSSVTKFITARKFSCKGKKGTNKIPTKLLNSGNRIPVLGLGTWESLNTDVKCAIKTAISSGYRMIDTAFVYQNEKAVGEAIREMIDAKVVKRGEIFVTTKLWNTYHRPDLVAKAACKSLDNLGLSYVDLYIMHWPTAYKEGDVLLPRDAKGETIFSNVDYVDTWKAMEELQDLELTKSLGLSNFNKSQIERILSVACIKPALLQCECHPFLNQAKLMEFCKSKGIAFTAYSPLGGSKDRPYAVKGEERLMDSKVINDMAKRINRTPAQILIRFQIQRGNVVIPKSVNKHEIDSNLKVFDWELSAEDMDILCKMNKNHRYVDKVIEAFKHPDYPFNDKY